MADDIRRLSDELARDPGGLAFLELAELLRRRRDLPGAASVAERGRDRHPGLAAAHDLVARIAADRGDLAAAAASWRTALNIDPDHGGANKGLGFIAYRGGRLREAAEHLSRAARANPDDAAASSALAKVTSELAASPPSPSDVPPVAAAPDHGRASTGSRPRIGAQVFADAAAGIDAVLLVDRDGLILAGAGASLSADRAAEIGAHLTGVSDEAGRAMRHLELGGWTALMIDAPQATVALAPAGSDAITVVAAPGSVPLGLVRRQLARSAEQARAWLAEAVG